MIYRDPVTERTYKAAEPCGPWIEITDREYDERLEHYERTGHTYPLDWHPGGER